MLAVYMRVMVANELSLVCSVYMPHHLFIYITYYLYKLFSSLFHLEFIQVATTVAQITHSTICMQLIKQR